MNNSRQLDIKRYTISPELYQQGYPEGEGPCKCTSRCCSHGVYADVTERDKILAHKEIIKKYLDETQTPDEQQWFDPNEEDDSDFVSGRCIGTQVINNKCALLDKLGRCSLQLAATAEGMHKWELKPIFCILFPLAISEGVLCFDDLLDKEQRCCSVTNEFTTSLAEGCKEELRYVFGEEGYMEAARHRKSGPVSTTKVPMKEIA